MSRVGLQKANPTNMVLWVRSCFLLKVVIKQKKVEREKKKKKKKEKSQFNRGGGGGGFHARFISA